MTDPVCERDENKRLSNAAEHRLEADIASDPDFRDEPKDWFLHATPVPASVKTPLSIRLDADIVAWFRLQGPGYQTRINAVLRTYVQHAAKKHA